MEMALSMPVIKVTTDSTDSAILRIEVGNVLEPSDFYFGFFSYDTGRVVAVILKKHYDATGYWSDQQEDRHVCPPGFGDLMEGVWETPHSEAETKRMMLELGFIENQAMADKGT